MLAEHGQHAHACSTHRAGSLLEHSVHCMLGPSGQPPHPNAHIVRDCTQAGAPACMCAQPHGVAVIDCATLLLAVVPTAPPNLLSCWLCTASSLRKHPTGRTAHETLVCLLGPPPSCPRAIFAIAHRDAFSGRGARSRLAEAPRVLAPPCAQLLDMRCHHHDHPAPAEEAAAHAHTGACSRDQAVVRSKVAPATPTLESTPPRQACLRRR